MKMDWLEVMCRCFDLDRVLYSGHARKEMLAEEFGIILDQEVDEAIHRGEVIETYPDDKPYPSVLIFGMTESGRPVHTVCAYNAQDDQAIVVTVYQPNPNVWEDYRRRKT